MSTLIIGGLLLIGVLALIGLFFVIRSEPRAQKLPASADKALSMIEGARASTAETATHSPPGSPPAQPAQSVLQSSAHVVPSAAPFAPSSVSEAPDRTMVLPRRKERFIPPRKEEQQTPVMDGQFHELSVELHTLHQRSQEIEHRLNGIMELVARIEHSQNNYTYQSEPPSSSSDTPSVA